VVRAAAGSVALITGDVGRLAAVLLPLPGQLVRSISPAMLRIPPTV
jgi:hypothetical protein